MLSPGEKVEKVAPSYFVLLMAWSSESSIWTLTTVCVLLAIYCNVSQAENNDPEDTFSPDWMPDGSANKRLSEFLGGPGKRVSEFLGGPGKRVSEFLGGPGKRVSEFLGGPGKRVSEFLGGPGKRTADYSNSADKRVSEFLGGPGKRLSEFLGGPGKRYAMREALSKRLSEFLGGPGKRAFYDYLEGSTDRR